MKRMWSCVAGFLMFPAANPADSGNHARWALDNEASYKLWIARRVIGQGRHQYHIDPTPIHVHDFEAESVDREVTALCRNSLELRHDESAHGSVGSGGSGRGCLEGDSCLQLVDSDCSIDEPAPVFPAENSRIFAN